MNKTQLIKLIKEINLLKHKKEKYQDAVNLERRKIYNSYGSEIRKINKKIQELETKLYSVEK
jgi:hypothetical protein